MYAQVEKPKENKSRAVANSVTQEKSDRENTSEFDDNRTEIITQRSINLLMNNNSVIKFNTNNVAQRYYACVANDWRKKDLYLPTGTGAERKVYAKDKLKTAYRDGVNLVNEVNMVSDRVNDKDYIHVSENEQYADPNTASIDKTIELSDVLPTYNVKKACVIQALIKFKGSVFGKSTAVKLHNEIFAQLKYEIYREYDLDDVFPVLYSDNSLTKSDASDVSLENLVNDSLTAGSKYIVECAPTTPGTSGHMLVVKITKPKKKKIWNDIQDSGNSTNITNSTIISSYWS